MSTTIYPAADRASQWFGTAYVGSMMDANNVVLHSTEGYGWPGYSGGATAPHFTVKPDFTAKTVRVRQHFPVNRSARALENRSGGVETNTLGCVQFELVGTCDPTTHQKWVSAGIQHIYMPEAPDWFLAGVADVLKWFDANWPKFQLKDGAPRGWGAYPASYGASKYRMTYAEWEANYGIVGHQHVPENAHGDPGAFPIAKLVQIATGAVTPVPAPAPDPTPTVLTAVWGDPTTWKIGSVGPDVTRLGQRLEVHLAALGLPAPYVTGPGPEFTETDRSAVAAFQTAQGWTGDGADGYPGVETFKRLEADVPTPVETTTIKVMLLPTAGYNADTAPGVTRWKSNTDGLAALVNKHMPDLVGTTEMSNRAIDPMLPRFTAAVPKFAREPGGTDGRYMFRNRGTATHVASGHVNTSDISELDDDDKQAAWCVVDINGVRVQGIVAHTENQDGIDKASGINADTLRVMQATSMLDRAIRAGEAYKPAHVIYIGDFNSESLVKNAMVARGWKAVGPGYFTRWDDSAKKTFDWGFIAHGTATFERINHAYSDHTALLIKWTVTK